MLYEEADFALEESQVLLMLNIKDLSSGKEKLVPYDDTLKQKITIEAS